MEPNLPELDLRDLLGPAQCQYKGFHSDCVLLMQEPTVQRHSVLHDKCTLPMSTYVIIIIVYINE